LSHTTKEQNEALMESYKVLVAKNFDAAMGKLVRQNEVQNLTAEAAANTHLDEDESDLSLEFDV